MASTNAQPGMVILKEGAPARPAAPSANHPPGGFMRQGTAQKPGTDQDPCKEADGGAKSMSRSRETMKTGGLKLHNGLKGTSDGPPPDSTCKGVSVTLDNNSMWREFFSCRTEMVVTKEGSRMFPYCRFHISGLQPSKKYCLLMDIQPLDSSQYCWTGDSWEVSTKGEGHIKSRPFAHPDSPATGQHWMQSPVSFYRLKLTNNISCQEGNIVLHPMHRYLPRLYLVQTEKTVDSVRLNGPSVLTFTFPQTEFIAVTAYQNPQLAQLKINYNPFAKGLNENGSSLLGLRLKLCSSKDSNKDGGNDSAVQHPVKKNLKSLLANHKPRSSRTGNSKSPEAPQRSCTPTNDCPATKVLAESPRSTCRPPQKLFSELIREAHVSLQRCNLNQLSVNNSSFLSASQANVKPSTPSGGRGQPHGSTRPPTRNNRTVVGKHTFSSPVDKDTVPTDSSGSGNPPGSLDSSEHEENPIAPSVKEQKRPARVPLPALALFLKQRSTKLKNTKLGSGPNTKLGSGPDTKLGSGTTASPSEPKCSAAASDCITVDTPVSRDSGLADTDFHVQDINVTEKAEEMGQQSSGPLCTGPDPDPEGLLGSHPAISRDSLVLTNPNEFSSLRTSSLSTCATSSSSSSEPPLLNPVVPALNPPQTPTGSSALPSDLRTLKTEPLLPDPECSSLDFEPLSPASSPEPLPPLPASLASELDSMASDPARPPEDSPQTENSSVFKWHTVLPPLEPYVSTTFPAFPIPPAGPPGPPPGHVALPLLSEPQNQNPPLLSESQTQNPPLLSETQTQNPPLLSESQTQNPPLLSESQTQNPPLLSESQTQNPPLLSESQTQNPPLLSESQTQNPPLLSESQTQNPPLLSESQTQHPTLLSESQTQHPTLLSESQTQHPTLLSESQTQHPTLLSEPQTQHPPLVSEPQTQNPLLLSEPQTQNPLLLSEPQTQNPLLLSEPQTQNPLLSESQTQHPTLLSESQTQHSTLLSEPQTQHPPLLSEPQTQNPLLLSEAQTHHPTLLSEPQTQDTSRSTLSSDATMSFQDSEQLLPFPAELSPLTLQLSLSPSFSSLDGDSLSPTPSLSDLVHFFSSDGDAGIGEAFPNTEAAAPPPAEEVQKPPPLEQPATKTCRKKKSKLSRLDGDEKMEDYRSMQPNLEEVEEQLFISFTSKEALKLHVPELPEPPAPETECPTPQPAEDEQSNGRLQETITVLQETLLRDLQLMKYRQVIHPELQEVGLKMTLLDPGLSIDLQYLGVHLPLPPPGGGTVPSPQGGSPAFLSRTGKTTDVTQIKGWRDKFTLPEAPPIPASSTPEAGPSCDLQKKNLSAFCSDMLDEYLENEGKLINERAASFSQPPAEAPAYELPMKSTSYVRTMDHVLKNQTAASDLISGFIPPSKRPRLKETKTCRRAKIRGPRHTKPRPEPGVSPGFESGPAPALLETTEPSNKSTFKRRRKFKPQTSSQTLSPARPAGLCLGMPEDLAPLESDSELVQSEEARGRPSRPITTRALLRQQDLEDGVVAEGRYRTSITEERAAIALTSLFTLTGFVRENPTAPIQVGSRRTSLCLNDFCRLGCICSSLTHTSRPGHCGRSVCMFGCSCLKQKVVLLKNLDSPDTSPGPLTGSAKKRKRRRRRMKMAYILKEADSVSKPADRIRTLWRWEDGVFDPEPVCIPAASRLSCQSRPSRPPRLPRPPRTSVVRQNRSTCARVRGFRRKTQNQKEPLLVHQEAPDDQKMSGRKAARLKFLKRRDPKLKKRRMDTSSPQHGEGAPPPNPPEPPQPKPSKRLFIMAGCKWNRDSDQTYVLRKLCEAMAQDRLDQPFWIRSYLISPQGQTIQGSGADQCVQYRIRISRPNLKKQNPAAPRGQRDIRAAGRRRQKDHLKQVTRNSERPEDCQEDMEEAEPPEDWQKEVMEEAESVVKKAESPEDWKKEVMEKAKPPVDWQKEVMEEAEPLEDWQKEVIEEVEPLVEKVESPEDWQKEVEEEVEPPEDWQKEVEEGDIEEEPDACSGDQVDDGHENIREVGSEKIRKFRMALSLTGHTPVGLLSANKKQPGGTNHLIQVNGKSYPLAKIQLGRMGALHPANRLAAYLTGRVQSCRQQPVPPRSSLCSGRPPQSSGTTTKTISAPVTTTSPTTSAGSQPPVNLLTPPTESLQPVNLLQNPTPPKSSQVVLVHVQGPRKTTPLPFFAPRLPNPPSTRQRMILQPIQSTSGNQYYLKPDGKVVQLIPISQLRPVNPDLPVQRGSSLSPSSSSSSSSTSALCAPSLRDPTVTVVRKPLTLSLPLKKPSLKILTSRSSRDPIVLTCANPPPLSSSKSPQPQTPSLPVVPVNVTSPKPAGGQGVEPGIKTVLVSGGLPSPERVVVQHRPGPPKSCPPIETTNSPTATAQPPNDGHFPNDELARHPIDLDIICVDDEAGHVTETKEVMKPTSSSETENSSDSEDGGMVQNKNRFQHNVNERRRREQLHQRFTALEKEVLQNQEVLPTRGVLHNHISRNSTLRKAAKLIQELRRTEKVLKRTKMSLRRRRDGYLSVLLPSAAEQPDAGRTGMLHVSEETKDVSRVSSDEKDIVGSSRMAASKDAAAVSDCKRSFQEDLEELTGEQQENRGVAVPQRSPEEMRSSKLKKTDGSSVVRIAKGKLPGQVVQRKVLKMVLDTGVHMEEPSSTAADSGEQKSQLLPAGDGASMDDIRMASSFLQRVPLALPTPAPAPAPLISVHTPVQVPLCEHNPQVPPLLLAPPNVSQRPPEAKRRAKTVPNILSRSKRPVRRTTLNTKAEQGGPPLYETLVPTEVLSLVGQQLPGQQVLNLNPAMMEGSLLQAVTGPAPKMNNMLSVIPPAPFQPQGDCGSVEPSHQQPQHQPGPPALVQNSRVQESAPAQTLRPESSQNLVPRTDRITDGRSEPEEAWSTLLHEISYLNQQTVATTTTAKELSSDRSEDVGGLKLQDHAQRDSEGCSEGAKGGVLAPPPLLQMKVGGATHTGSSKSDTAVGAGGVAWRPMPRLVPLGLRGTSPS